MAEIPEVVVEEVQSLLVVVMIRDFDVVPAKCECKE